MSEEEPNQNLEKSLSKKSIKEKDRTKLSQKKKMCLKKNISKVNIDAYS